MKNDFTKPISSRSVKKTLPVFLFLLIALALSLSSPLPAQAAKSYSGKKTTKKNPAVVLYVQYSCAPYSDALSASHDITRCTVKDRPGYRVYDIIIYPDRINLYAFPDMTDWDSFAAFYTSRYGSYDTRTAETEEAAWKAFRDKYLLKSFKVKSGTYENNNPEKNSAKRLKAYKSFFKIIKKKTPSKHIAVKYQGHGEMIPYFCHSLSLKDTKKALAAAVKTFKCKLAMVDYGTNCYTMTSTLCDLYEPYVDYVLGDATDWGGCGSDETVSAEANHFSDIDGIYYECFPLGTTIKKAVIRSWSNNTNSLKLMCPKSIKRSQTFMTQTVVNLKEYKKLIKSLKSRTGNLKADCKTKAQKKRYKKAIVKHFTTHELGVKTPNYYVSPF